MSEKELNTDDVDFEPFGDRVLVKQDEPEAAPTRGGIVIPDSQKEAPLEGRALRVGIGRWEHGTIVPPQTRPGDQVLFGRYAGSPLWLGGVEYLLLREEEILGRRKNSDQRSGVSDRKDQPA